MSNIGETRTWYLLVPIATIISFVLLYQYGFSTGEAFYLSFTFGVTVGSIIALTERERNIMGAVAFATLLVALGVIPQIVPIATSTLSIVAPTAQIEIPTSMVPWLMLGLVAFMAVGVSVGASPSALALWVLSVVMVMVYYLVNEPLLKLFSIVIVAVIAGYPLLTATGARRYPLLLPIALGSKGATYQINLSEINPYAVLLLPILTFISLDPFNVITRRVYKDIASVLAVFVVLLHVVELFIIT